MGCVGLLWFLLKFIVLTLALSSLQFLFIFIVSTVSCVTLCAAVLKGIMLSLSVVFCRVLAKILMPGGSKDVPVGKALCVIVS